MTVYEAFGDDKPNVTKDDIERLKMIEDQHEAIQHVVWNSPEPGPTAALVFFAHDGISVVTHALSLHEAFEANKKYDRTGEAMVLTLGGPPSGLAAILRKRKFTLQAEMIEGSPPEGSAFVVCVANGGATVAAIPVTPVIPLGQA